MAYEIPLYRFRTGVAFEQAKAAVLSLNDFLRTAEGFTSRRTVYDRKNDTWIDFVEWESMDLALKAMDDFGKSALFQEWSKLADPDHGHMYHGEVIQTFRKE